MPLKLSKAHVLLRAASCEGFIRRFESSRHHGTYSREGARNGQRFPLLDEFELQYLFQLENRVEISCRTTTDIEKSWFE